MISYAPSTDSTKVTVQTSTSSFKTILPKADIPKSNPCLNGGSGCPTDPNLFADKLWVAKLVSCVGGALIWFCILFWGMTCLPDFSSLNSATVNNQSPNPMILLAKTKKVILNHLEPDLLIITED